MAPLSLKKGTFSLPLKLPNSFFAHLEEFHTLPPSFSGTLPLARSRPDPVPSVADGRLTQTGWTPTLALPSQFDSRFIPSSILN